MCRKPYQTDNIHFVIHMYNKVPRNWAYAYVIKDFMVHFIRVLFDMFYYNWSEEYRSL